MYEPPQPPPLNHHSDLLNLFDIFLKYSIVIFSLFPLNFPLQCMSRCIFMVTAKTIFTEQNQWKD